MEAYDNALCQGEAASINEFAYAAMDQDNLAFDVNSPDDPNCSKLDLSNILFCRLNHAALYISDDGSAAYGMASRPGAADGQMAANQVFCFHDGKLF